MNTNNLDIVDSKQWGKAQWLTFFQDRLSSMSSARQEAEGVWETVDGSMNMVSFYNNLGELVVSVPLDKILIEIYEGRTSGIINYDIKSDGQTDEQQLQPAKYALQFFLDGNDDKTFWYENKTLKSLKARYGNGIFFTGMRSEKEYMYGIKDEIEPGTDLLDEKNFKEYIKEDWHFFPKNIRVQDFYIDDKAINQPYVNNADDCIYKENITFSELNLRYKDNKSIDKKELKAVTYGTDSQSGKTKEDTILIHHYYNRIDKTYMIVANETQLLLKTKYLYDDGKLPFVNIQHYYNPTKFYAEGIPTRVGYLKASKSKMMEEILATASMGSGMNLIIGNDEQLTDEWQVGGKQMNLWRTTGGAENVQQVNTTPNLGIFTTILQLIDQETAIVTGIDPRAQVGGGAEILGIAELNEANKAVRTGSVDESYELGLDSTLTMTLARIKQFAPSLLAETKKNKAGNIIKIIFPTITIPNAKVVKEKGIITIKEDLGKNGYFELKPDVVQGVGVKIVTKSTRSAMPIMERKRVGDYINLQLQLAQIAQLDPTGKAMEDLMKNVRFDELLEVANDSYGFDQDKLKANTQKDEIRKENLALLKKLKEQLTITDNAQTTEQNQGVPMEGQGQGIEQPQGGITEKNSGGFEQQ